MKVLLLLLLCSSFVHAAELSTSPVSDLFRRYNLAVQHPFSSRFALSVSGTLFRDHGLSEDPDRHGRIARGGQLGARAHWVMAEPPPGQVFDSAPISLRLGVYRLDESVRDAYVISSPSAQLEALALISLRKNSALASLGAGISYERRGSSSEPDTYRLIPVILEINVGAAF